jgi:hypothetical protein
LQANIGADYYLGEKLDNDKIITGMVFGFRNSFYNGAKNLKTEMVFGLNYRYYSINNKLVLNTDAYGRIVNFPAVVYINPKNPYNIDTSGISHRETFLYILRADIFELPIYFEYNNKVKLISPVFQGGVMPYLIRKKEELELSSTYDPDWSLHSRYILGFGLGINYKRLCLKYVIHLQPFLMNSLELNFLLN